MCGEHSESSPLTLVDSGSSPRVRGTLRSHFPVDAHCGIIPACAGNTRARSPYLRCERDHPRVRGEHKAPFPYTISSTGSSPRVRGTPLHRRGPRGPRVAEGAAVVGVDVGPALVGAHEALGGGEAAAPVQGGVRALAASGDWLHACSLVDSSPRLALARRGGFPKTQGCCPCARSLRAYGLIVQPSSQGMEKPRRGGAWTVARACHSLRSMAFEAMSYENVICRPAKS